MCPEIGPDADDLALGDEEASARSLGLSRDDDADGERTEPLHAADLAGGVLERRDPVAEARRILEAQVARQAFELGVQTRQGVVERLPVDALESTRGELCPATALQRPDGPGVAEQTTLSPRRRR